MSKEDAFVSLIHANQGLIFKIATIYAKEKAEQDDLYQEIVYQTWKSFDSFKKAAQPSTWLYRVGMNTAITHLNKSKKKINTMPFEELNLQFSDSIDLDKEERIQLLYAQIRKLNLLDRGIIFLFLEDKSYEEIAEISGISVSNVGTRMARIRQKLKSEMNPKPVEYGTR